MVGNIKKELTFLRPKYNIDFNGWRCEGNFMEWDYNVFSGGNQVVKISKEIFHWGDTYVINIANASDEIPALMLALAIDAANCSKNRN